MRREVGDAVRIEMAKWGDRPHWHIPARWLGSDEHGDWLGIPAGTVASRKHHAMERLKALLGEPVDA